MIQQIEVPIHLGWMPDKLPHEIPMGGLAIAKNGYRHNGLWKPWSEVGFTSSMSTLTTVNQVAAFPVKASATWDIDTYIFIDDGDVVYRVAYDQGSSHSAVRNSAAPLTQ